MVKLALWIPNSLRYVAGGVKWTLQASSLLQKRGHYVEIFASPFSFHKSAKEMRVPVFENVTYKETWSPNLKNFDVVYILYNPLSRLCKIDKEKAIAGLHSPLWYSRIVDLRFCLKNFDSWIYLATKLFYSTLGVFDLRPFRKIHIINPMAKVKHQNIILIPNWVDMDFWKPKEEKKKDFSILFVGRRNLEKGWDIYVKTAQILKNSYPEFEFHASGPTYGFIKGINFQREEGMPALYSRFHVLVTPARLNAFPLTFLESLSCGTPVITLPTLAHIGLIRLGMPLFFGSTPEEISQKVLDVYTIWTKSRGEYDALCVQARESASKFDVHQIFPLFEKMLLET